MNYYHIGFFFEGGASADKLTAVQDAFSTLTEDWVRYGSASWIIFSGATVDQVYIPLREVLQPKDQFLVLPVDLRSARQGYLSNWIWRWLEIDRTQPGWRQKKDAILSYLQPPPPPALSPHLRAALEAAYKSLPPPKS
jgi:hypothetical protein